ncbi:response regulator transcription factor [Candidatus Synechococcus calcipolaris G9]|uniref:Response regulator transcription factor n=1 Tax=Candidatus Synechococcus calcipolaris G9 TaxID=1497997 RepID=A0ABT6EXA6_9SYNE|nr:response regulator transcription factor [Candidatus Synechococcus calcipolaris]MDG2989992.1 response regulator transcription factor [Candidatus Synechococcus calcipolaris G9]
MQTSVHIEIVEGNPHLRSLLGWHLQQAGHVVHLAGGCQQAQEVFQLRHPDLVILDSDLPDGNGLELCRWLKRQQELLVFMLSARATEVDIVTGLRAGADDYLTKPFGMQEFLARIDCLSRRSRPLLPAYLNCGDMQIDLVQRRLLVRDSPVDLTPQEFSLLYVLAQAGGNPLSRQELLNRAWPDNIDNPRTVDTHILALRKKIEVDPQQPRLVQTVRNVGYRLNLEPLNVSHHHQMTTAVAKHSRPARAVL